MKNKFFYSLMFLLVSLSTVGQKKVDWKDLSKVKFKEKYFKVYDEWMLYPNFSESVKALNGREISISGYFLDVDPTGKMYVLSKNPMSSCFFCGGGGLETAMELQFATKQKIKTDAIITVTGTLKLNKDDIEHFNYILKNCNVTSEK